MRQAEFFISYRRDDSAGFARALHDALAARFGAEAVFMDVDDIGAGQAFAQVLDAAVGGSQVLLVLIGRRWLGDRPGQAPRIQDTGDFVRREVATGLARGLRVVPVLIDGASLPAAEQLPSELQPLLQRNAFEIGHSRFATDVQRLGDALQPLAPATPIAAAAPAAPPRRTAVWAATGLGLAGLLAALGWQMKTPAPVPVAAPPARPAVNGRWQAEVSYDWPNAHFTETFEFSGEGHALQGQASFLKVPRTLMEGQFTPDGLRFHTRSSEVAGGSTLQPTHRYEARRVGEELQFTMQTEGASSAHALVRFTARRVGTAP